MMRGKVAWTIGGIVVLLAALVGLVGAAPGGTAAVSAPSLVASPREIDFGPVGVGATSAPIAVSFYNLSDTSFLSPFTGGGVGAPFLRTDECNFSVPPQSNCRMLFTFAPETAGVFTATSEISTDAGPATIVMHGVGVGPKLHLTPQRVDFGSVLVNDMASAQTALIRNAGLAHLDFLEISQPGAPFTVTPMNCLGGLDPGASCALSLQFAPAAAGQFTTTAVVDTTGGRVEIPLRGFGRAAGDATGQRVTPTVLDFGPVGVGATSAFQRVTFYNQSSDDHLIDWSGGATTAPFARATDCQDDIDPATSCVYDFTFSPTAAGSFSQTVRVTNNLGTVEIVLRGDGVAPRITSDALVLEFPPVAPGQTSPPQTVTMRNDGLAPAQMFGGAPDPGNIFGASTTCGALMPPGTTCEVFYTFEPDTLGRLSATSTFALDAQGHYPFAVLLAGGALTPGLTLSFAPATVDPGEVTRLQIALANSNPSLALANVSLLTQLPQGLVIADPPEPMVGGDCAGGSFQPVAGSRAVVLSSGLLGGKTCAMSVRVVAATRGRYTVSATATSDSGPSNAATATLGVGTGYPLFLPFVRR